jgi:hypothetical protein
VRANLIDNLDLPISTRSQQTDIDTLLSLLTVTRAGNLDNLDVLLSTRADQSSVDAIPTNPALANDSRFDFLDAAISSRATDAGAGNVQTDITEILTRLGVPSPDLASQMLITRLIAERLDTDLTTARAANLDNLDAPVSSRASQTSVDAIPTNPALTNDPRFDNLDAPITSRATNEGVALAGAGILDLIGVADEEV